MRIFIVLLGLYATLLARERLVILSPALNEIIFALGGGDQVVGNTTYANYPEESRHITKVGGYFDANLERILGLKPTLVLMEKHHERMEKRLKKFGITVQYVAIRSLEDIRTNIQLAGQILGKESEAENLAEEVFDSIPNSSQAKKTCRMLLVFGAGEHLSIPVYAAGHNVYYQDLITRLGCENVIPDTQSGQPVLSREMILRLNPTHVLILLPDITDFDSGRLIDSWKALPVDASKNDRIQVINRDYVFVPSQRIGQLWKDIKALQIP